MPPQPTCPSPAPPGWLIPAPPALLEPAEPARPGPVPAPPGVDLWWFDARAETVRPADAAVMDAGERRRARTLLSALDRHRFEVAHVLLRRVLAGYLAAAPADLLLGRQRCPRCGRGPGRPVLLPGHGAAPCFSLAHSGDLVLIAVAGRPVGVDLERDPATCVCPVSEVLHPATPPRWHRCPSRTGTRPSSAAGCGRRRCSSAPGRASRTGMRWSARWRPGWPGTRGRPDCVRGCSVRGLPAPPGYQAAVALAGPGGLTTRTMAAPPGPG